MKILIVAPQYKTTGFFYELPIGMAYITSVLKKAGHEVEVVNINEEVVISENHSIDPAYKYNEVVMTGGLSVYLNSVKSIVDRAKQVNPNIKTVIGGGLFSSEPELMMDYIKPDVGVIGEGEKSCITALTAPKGTIIQEDMVDDISDLPFPDFDAFKIKSYLARQLTGDEHYTYPLDNPRVLPLISSRSCPFNCTFCYHPLGKKYRQRTIKNIADEIELHKKKYDINMLTILDELISNDTERLTEMCNMLKRFNLKWMCQMRVSNVTKDIIRMMKSSGCFQISYGIEHIDDGVLKSMKKHTTKADIENALKVTYENGIGIQGNILFGDPAETYDTVHKAVKWLYENKRYGINATPVISYPGSELYKHHVKVGSITPLDYIKKGCGFVGIIPAGFNFDKQLPGEIIAKQCTREDKYRGNIYTVKAKCFHCEQENTYSGIFNGGTNKSFVGGNVYRIACRKCNQRFDIIL